MTFPVHRILLVEDSWENVAYVTALLEEVRDGDGNPVLDADGKPVMRPRLDEDGKPMVASVQRYSDTLAIFLLKAHAPDKYRERTSVDLKAQVSINDMSEADMVAQIEQPSELVATEQ